MISYLLLLIGLILVFIEFYLPGGVMGTAGAVILVISMVVMLSSGASALSILIFLVLMILGIIITIKTALWSIRRTKTSKSIFLESDQEGYRASRYETDLVGKEGICHTMLHPGGYVVIEGKKYAAISNAGFIKKGERIEVLEVEGETLKVRRL